MLHQAYKTRGLIIKKRSYRETDKVIIVLSPDYGRVEILARGVRKSGNVFSGLLEPMMVGEFLLVRGKTWDSIKDMTLMKDYTAWLGKENMVLYKGSSFILQTLNRLSNIDRDEKSFFDLGLSYLDGLVKNFSVVQDSDKMKMYLSSFVMSVLAVSGRLPCFFGCVVCEKDDCRNDDGWNLTSHGLMHRQCIVNTNFTETTIVLTCQDKKNIENLLLMSGEKFINLNIDRVDIEKIYSMTLFLLSAYLGQDIGQNI